MTTPWPYTGQAVPRTKPTTSSAAPQRPARVVSDLVPISTPSRNNGTQAGKARAQATEQGFKAKTTTLLGGTPKRLWPTAVDSADRQDETAAATTPNRNMAERRATATTSVTMLMTATRCHRTRRAMKMSSQPNLTSPAQQRRAQTAPTAAKTNARAPKTSRRFGRHGLRVT